MKESIKTAKPMTADEIIDKIAKASKYGGGSDGISVVDLDD
jgi:hypothetical protein